MARLPKSLRQSPEMTLLEEYPLMVWAFAKKREF